MRKGPTVGRCVMAALRGLPALRPCKLARMDPAACESPSLAELMMRQCIPVQQIVAITSRIPTEMVSHKQCASELQKYSRAFTDYGCVTKKIHVCLRDGTFGEQRKRFVKKERFGKKKTFWEKKAFLTKGVLEKRFGK